MAQDKIAQLARCPPLMQCSAQLSASVCIFLKFFFLLIYHCFKQSKQYRLSCHVFEEVGGHLLAEFLVIPLEFPTPLSTVASLLHCLERELASVITNQSKEQSCRLLTVGKVANLSNLALASLCTRA